MECCWNEVCFIVATGGYLSWNMLKYGRGFSIFNHHISKGENEEWLITCLNNYDLFEVKH
jgi:hypothetical protein